MLRERRDDGACWRSANLSCDHEQAIFYRYFFVNIALLKTWAHAPWHSWLKAEPAWVELISQLLARLPDRALQRLLCSARPLIVLPPAYCGRVVRLTQALPAGANILQLDAGLLGRPAGEALGILAHELGHLCVPDSMQVYQIYDDELKNDLAADRVARSWGFGAELIQALQRDLEDGHPRIVAAQSAA